MAYKAGEGTPQRTPNSTNNPRSFLPLKIASMTTTLPRNAFLICEIEVSPNGGPGFCCGMTKKDAPCKNSIKLEDTKIGHQKLNTLTRESFQLSTLQSKLCAIAKEFLCTGWHRQRQGQQWYEAAVRNQARVPHDSRVAIPSIVHPRQRRQPPGDAWRNQTTLTGHSLTGSDKTHRCPCEPALTWCNELILLCDKKSHGS